MSEQIDTKLLKAAQQRLDQRRNEEKLDDTVALASDIVAKFEDLAKRAQENGAKALTDEELLVEARIRNESESRHQWRTMGIPSGLFELVCKPFDPGHQAGWNQVVAAKTLASDWKAVKSGASIMLVGPTGCGKTHLALRWLWMLRQLQPRKSEVRWGYLHLPTWAHSKRQSWEISSAAYGVRVFDDVGREAGFDFEQTKLLISAAHNVGSQMIVTTELSPEQFADRYGANNLSRIQAGSGIVRQLVQFGVTIDLR